jgi:hypothetical protein
MSKTLTFAQILSSPVAASASAFYEKSSSFVRFVHIVSGLFCFASTVVPQQLSQKAFEKLATNQDLSNAIEKVSKDDDVDFYGSSLCPGGSSLQQAEFLLTLPSSEFSTSI